MSNLGLLIYKMLGIVNPISVVDFGRTDPQWKGNQGIFNPPYFFK